MATIRVRGHSDQSTVSAQQKTGADNLTVTQRSAIVLTSYTGDGWMVGSMDDWTTTAWLAHTQKKNRYVPKRKCYDLTDK